MELLNSNIDFNSDNYAFYIIKNSNYIPLENVSKQGCFPLYLSKHKLNKNLFYVNVASLTESNRFYLEQHIKVNNLLNNPNSHFVSLVEHFEFNNSIYIVLEHLDSFLIDFLKKEYSQGMPEIIAFFYFQQMFMALKQMHKLNIIHRDFKIGRILICKHQIKITGFSYSYIVSKDIRINKVYNEDVFTAPEIENFIQKESNPFKIDTYSLGVILYVLLTNQIPDNILIIRNNLIDNNYKFSDDARDLILNCITEDADKRFGTKEIEDSKWFLNSVEIYQSLIKDKDLDFSTIYSVIVNNLKHTISSINY